MTVQRVNYELRGELGRVSTLLSLMGICVDSLNEEVNQLNHYQGLSHGNRWADGSFKLELPFHVISGQ